MSLRRHRQVLRKAIPEGFARRHHGFVNRLRINHHALLGNACFLGHRERTGAKCRRKPRVFENCPERTNPDFGNHGLFAALNLIDHFGKRGVDKNSHRFGPIKEVRIIQSQEREFFPRIRILENHRCGKAAADGDNRIFFDVSKDPFVGLFGKNECATVPGGFFFTRKLQRQIFPGVSNQAEGNRNDKRLFFGLPRCGCRGLVGKDRAGLGNRVKHGAHPHARGAGLAVPTGKLCQVHAADLGKGREEIVTRDGLTVKTREVIRETLLKSVFSENRLEHTHDFRPFLVDGHRVKVVDLSVAFRSNGVRHGTGIFRKLCLA